MPRSRRSAAASAPAATRIWTDVELPRYEDGPEEGPQALLMHGLSSDAGGWWQTVDHLVGRGWRVTRVDLRGHGRAERSRRYGVPDYAGDVLDTRPRARG